MPLDLDTDADCNGSEKESGQEVHKKGNLVGNARVPGIEIQSLKSSSSQRLAPEIDTRDKDDEVSKIKPKRPFRRQVIPSSSPISPDQKKTQITPRDRWTDTSDDENRDELSIQAGAISLDNSYRPRPRSDRRKDEKDLCFILMRRTH